MARKILAAVVLVPLALVMVALAVANRAAVTISFDPFDPASPAYTLKAPLFVLALILLAVGVIVGVWTAVFVGVGTNVFLGLGALGALVGTGKFLSAPPFPEIQIFLDSWGRVRSS